MKKFALAICLSLFSFHLFAEKFEGTPREIIHCQDANPEVRDEGVSVSILEGGLPGKTQALLYRQSIRGPQMIGTYLVSSRFIEDTITYYAINSRSGFILTVEKNSTDSEIKINATLSAVPNLSKEERVSALLKCDYR